jgi:hypothetical protein
MQHRTLFAPLVATLLLSGLVTNADAAAASPSQPASVAAQAAAADKVYPPLPSLALLPPDSSDDEPLPPSGGTSRKKHGRAVMRVRQVAPTVKLIVTDESRAYLQDIEKQLDAALAK